MKLVTYIEDDARRLGVADGEEIIDVAAAYKAAGKGRAPADLRTLLEAGEGALDTLKEIAAAAGGNVRQPAASATLDAPLRNPSKLMCVGLNYADHCREQGVPLPENPMFFMKFPSAIVGPEMPITWPADMSEQVDYEAELAVLIGKKARNVSATDALNYVAGYTMVNDISARDVQFADKQWIRGKSFDSFCPMGPYFVTADEIDDPNNLSIHCRLNGETMQDSNTLEMIFKVPYLIEFITKTCTLLPGDVISTGTPHGVGVFSDPQVFLKPGDVVEVEIEGLGCLRNPVA